MTISVPSVDGLYRALIAAAPDGIIAIDAESTIMLANPALERMFGHPLTDLVGEKLVKLMPTALGHRHREGINRYMRTGHRRLDWRGTRATGLHADGTEIPIEISFGEADLDGTHLFIGFIRDLTEPERASEEMRRAKSLHDSILSAVGEAILGNNAYGVTTFANPAACELFGYSHAELIGSRQHQLIHHTRPDGSAFPLEECALYDALRSGQTIAATGELFFRKDGAPLHLDVVSTPILEGDQVIGAVLSFRDVSQSRRLEEQLRQSQKVEAVGQLAGGIAHDFNNLLTVILAHARFLLETLPPGSADHEDAEAIRAAGERAASLTSQLLAYSRRQVLVLEELRLGDVVAKLEPMLHRLIGEHIMIVAGTRSADDRVLADRGQLEQVITNLVINARDAMPSGGTLTIEVERPTHEMAVRFNLPPEDGVVLSVSDTGVGMDAATKARAFEPFFTTKEPGKGTGLGLATVFGIVTQLGGQVAIESEPGVGSSFYVLLPKSRAIPVPAPVARSTPVHGVERLHPTHGATILLVEDESTVRSAARRILERSGFRVIEARHGADALLVAGEFDAPIDLLLTDIVMPEVNGIELALWFEKAYPNGRTLFMSGYTDDDLFRRGLANRAVAFVAKPFTATALVAAVREALLRP